jgi:hypothetical protein
VLAKGVAQDSWYSYHAGRYWSDERFKPFAKRLAEKVAQDSWCSYLADCGWSDERKKVLDSVRS